MERTQSSEIISWCPQQPRKRKNGSGLVFHKVSWTLEEASTVRNCRIMVPLPRATQKPRVILRDKGCTAHVHTKGRSLPARVCTYPYKARPPSPPGNPLERPNLCALLFHVMTAVHVPAPFDARGRHACPGQIGPALAPAIQASPAAKGNVQKFITELEKIGCRAPLCCPIVGGPVVGISNVARGGEENRGLHTVIDRKDVGTSGVLFSLHFWGTLSWD